MKIKRRFSRTVIWIITSYIILLAGIASATPVVEWDKTFGEAGNDEAALSVEETEDGGYIIAGMQFAGYGMEIEELRHNALLIKTDENGNQVWIRTFGEVGGSEASSVQQTKERGYIITGSTTSSERGDLDIWLIKTDENGNLIWNKTFGGKSEDKGLSIQLAKDGGYILTGYVTHERVDPEPWYGNLDYDILLIKTDKDGNQQWNRTFGGDKYEVPNSVIQTSDSGFIIAAGIYSNEYNILNNWIVYGKNNNNNGWLIKTDNNGLEQWNRVLDENILTSIHQTKDNGYIIAGYSMFDFGNMKLIHYDFRNAWLIKTDGLGNTEWKKTFGGYLPRSVRQTNDSGYIVAGNTYPRLLTGQYRRDEKAWLLRTDEKGEELWSLLPGGRNYIAYSIRQTEDGSYVVAGTTDLYAMGRKPDAWLMKLREEPQTEPEKSGGFELILAMAMLMGVQIVQKKSKHDITKD